MGAEEVNGWEQEVKGWGWGVGGGAGGNSGKEGEHRWAGGEGGRRCFPTSLLLFFSVSHLKNGYWAPQG